jgi:hypothetical protein
MAEFAAVVADQIGYLASPGDRATVIYRRIVNVGRFSGIHSETMFASYFSIWVG